MRVQRLPLPLLMFEIVIDIICADCRVGGVRMFLCANAHLYTYFGISHCSIMYSVKMTVLINKATEQKSLQFFVSSERQRNVLFIEQMGAK